MKSRALRYLLVTLFAGLLVGAAYVVWDAESQGSTTTGAARGVDEHVRGATRALLDLRASQAGYVAAGQGEEFWAARVDGLLTSAREALTALQTRARTPQAQIEIESVAKAFDDFVQMDRRARGYARNGQRLLASDLVFSDGLGKIEVALTALEHARRAEQAANDATLRQGRRSQLLALAGTAAFGLLVLFMLAPLPPRTVAARPVARPVAEVTDAADPLPLNADVQGTRTPPPAAPPGPEPRALPAPAAPPAIAPAATLDLPGIASLCTDLARVIDMQALPPALERAARLLNASGIVVWISDPDGRELAAVMAYGYPPHLLARMGTIGRDDENATAAAFRTGLVQTVRADGDANGAIAAPLITPGGAVGVMAAEVLDDGETQDATRAAAAIVAAQLATLMGPPAVRTASGTAETAGATSR